ncbi:MAG: hypothetical protein K0R07_334 [Sedimentibacter sp.]|jgi:hypothetical protein|nr:hypothetical protein [Sedimentibacter sp.]
MYSIMAIKVEERAAKAPDLQEILTEHGCIIKTRVGFHETDEDKCSMDGIILLHLYGDKKEFQDLQEKIVKLDGVTPKFVEF